MGSKIGQKVGEGAGGKSADPVQHPPKGPVPKRKFAADCFPPQYNTIRAARANTSTITPLGGIGGVGRLQVRLGIGAATGGFEVKGTRGSTVCRTITC